MNESPLSEQLIRIFGRTLYENSKSFPNSQVNLFDLRKSPLKIRCLIFDNNREFHLIIDQKRAEIFHDCPSFLIHSEKEKKVCVHLIKTLLIIKQKFSFSVLNEFQNYRLTSEDFGSKKKSNNFLLLSNICLENNSILEALSYLNKAIDNEDRSEYIVKNYLRISVENKLFLELFNFLKIGLYHDLKRYFVEYNEYIQKGFNLLLNEIPRSSFSDLLQIIELISYNLDNDNLILTQEALNQIIEMANSNSFKERYFSIFFILKYSNTLIFERDRFPLISQDQFHNFKEEIKNYFKFPEENEEIKLLRKQIKIFDIPEDEFLARYKLYKKEIKKIKKKLILKKFSFLKILMYKYNINKTKGEFRKKRNTYLIRHDEQNLKNPVYFYIISHIGFYGTENQTIKSNYIGINYFIIKDLFLDDLTNHPDILYYRDRFWDTQEEIKINIDDGFSLLSKLDDINYVFKKPISDFKNIMIVEWDLAIIPFQESIVSAYDSQINVPDQNNPLFHDLKPFDLCYCYKEAIKIERNIKVLNVINKCSFKDAISNISKGMFFIERYYPFSLVKKVLNREISLFEAHKLAFQNPNKEFIPNYNKFLEAFEEFLYEFIKKEKEFVFAEFKKEKKIRPSFIIVMLNLSKDLDGIKLNYKEILENIPFIHLNLEKLRNLFLEKIHQDIQKLIDEGKIGSTKIFNLNKMQNSIFAKYCEKILDLRMKEFKEVKITKTNDIYDISELVKTYYGYQILKIFNIGQDYKIDFQIFNKILEFSNKLNLKLNVINQ